MPNYDNADQEVWFKKEQNKAQPQLKEEKTYQCKKCSETFIRQQALARHYQYVHKHIRPKSKEQQAKFVQRKKNIADLKKKIAEQKKGEKINKSGAVRRFDHFYSCRFCGKQYQYKNSFIVHLHKAHPQEHFNKSFLDEQLGKISVANPLISKHKGNVIIKKELQERTYPKKIKQQKNHKKIITDYGKNIDDL